MTDIDNSETKTPYGPISQAFVCYAANRDKFTETIYSDTFTTYVASTCFEDGRKLGYNEGKTEMLEEILDKLRRTFSR